MICVRTALGCRLRVTVAVLTMLGWSTASSAQFTPAPESAWCDVVAGQCVPLPIDQGSLAVYSPSSESAARLQRELAQAGAPEFVFREWVGTGLGSGAVEDFAWFTRSSGTVPVEQLVETLLNRTDWFLAPGFCVDERRLRWPSQAIDVTVHPPNEQVDLESVLEELAIEADVRPATSSGDAYLVGPRARSGFDVVEQASRLAERPEILSARVWWGGILSTSSPVCPIVGTTLPTRVPTSSPLGTVALAVSLLALGILFMRR